jgi:hypothetical protein
MTPLRPLIEQRIIEQVTGFEEVRGAASIAQMIDARGVLFVDRGCYVFQDRIATGATDSPTASSLGVWPQFAVVVTVRNVRDATGIDAADVAFDLLNGVRVALQGWTPVFGETSAMQYTGGQLISFENGFLTWRDTYRVNQYIQTANRG